MFSRKPDLTEQLLSIKLITRSLQKAHLKHQKKQKEYALKVKKAVAKGETESASCYAQQSIRFKTLSQRYLSLACRVEIIESMTQSAIDTGQITESISNIVSSVSQHVSPEYAMDKVESFERLFDDLQVSTGVIDNSIDIAAAPSTTENAEIENMLQWAQESNAQELGNQMERALPIVENNSERLKL
jgi:hypothetical protein